MSIATEASKLLTNKYFLYFMVFLAATNVLGYLVTNRINAVIFFALVSLLTFQFSKNMAVVLLVSIIATNFLMANRRMREGLDNQTTSTTSTTKSTKVDESTKAENTDDESGPLKNIDLKDKEIGEAMTTVKNAQSREQVLQDEITKNNVSSTETTPGKIIDINNPDKNKLTDEKELVGAGAAFNSKKNKTDAFGPRLDYAKTIEASYDNLDELLGSDSIKQLTSDTQKLMAQQQNLFNTMNQMVPILEGAQNMLKNFKIDGLADSLKSIGNIANVQLPGTNK